MICPKCNKGINNLGKHMRRKRCFAKRNKTHTGSRLEGGKHTK